MCVFACVRVCVCVCVCARARAYVCARARMCVRAHMCVCVRVHVWRVDLFESPVEDGTLLIKNRDFVTECRVLEISM